MEKAENKEEETKTKQICSEKNDPAKSPWSLSIHIPVYSMLVVTWVYVSRKINGFWHITRALAVYKYSVERFHAFSASVSRFFAQKY